MRNVKLQGSSGYEVRCQSSFWPGVPWDKKNMREEGPLVNVKGSSPSSAVMHSQQRSRHQKCQDEQGAPEQTPTQKGSLEREDGSKDRQPRRNTEIV